jgi:hypothetical protein
MTVIDHGAILITLGRGPQKAPDKSAETCHPTFVAPHREPRSAIPGTLG